MSKRSLCLLPFFVLTSCLLVTVAGASDPPIDSYGVRLATYDKAAGESYFALRVTPQVRPKPAVTQDIVVLVDTSASQRGPFRDDSLEAVTTLIGRLDRHDRVRLFAVDLEATPLCDQFVTAGSKECRDALARLQQRTPLGSTDMIGGLLGYAPPAAYDLLASRPVQQLGLADSPAFLQFLRTLPEELEATMSAFE